MQIAFEPALLAAVPDACDRLTTLIAAGRPALSLAIGAMMHPPGAIALRLDPPVLPIAIHATEALFGPVHVPGGWPCPGCLDYWLTLNQFDAGAIAEPSADLLLLVSRAVAEVSQRINAGDGDSSHYAVSIRVGDDRFGRHAVFPRQDCQRCGTFATRPLPLRTHCSPWTGIVNRVELSAHPTAGAYRASGVWASALPRPGARPLLKRQDSFGRGRTRADAEAGCIAEALERYSLIYRGDETMVRARLAEIDAIHPDAIQLFSDAQYRDRDTWNATAEDEMSVPERFDPDVAVDWLEAMPLSGGGPRYVPAACCLMWYQGHVGEPEFGRADTVGCAAGATYDDALTGALLEWVERDAMAIWWDNRLRRPGLRLESFESPELDEVIAGLAAIGRRLWLLDCTTDIGIPAYMSVAARNDGSEPLVSGAADLSPRRAAWRAASEVGQVWFDAQRTRGLAAPIRDWLLRETTDTQAFLAPPTFIDAPGEPAPSRQPPWRAVVERLALVGLEAYAVDHSRADVTLRTVRAVVPGLRHIWNRRAPGRLFDVPVSLGWMEQSLREDALNPIRCWL